MSHDFVKIVEVGPRDGLQNEPNSVPLETKLAFIEKLTQSGLSTIEATSFVSPKWVPQMADHAEVVKALDLNTDTQYPVLVPNLKGLENALALGVKDIAVFAAASESFSQKNINCSIEESLHRFTEVAQKAIQAGVRVRGYISCVCGCPYEGEITPKQVLKVAQKLFEAGCTEISLGDTIGVGTARKVRDLIKVVSSEIPHSQLAVHFHDTYGQAVANIYASLEEGIRVVDSAVSGLGGCPYAKGATGNVATEDVLYLLAGCGFETGVDLNKLVQAGHYMCNALKRDNQSKVARAILSKQ